MLMTIKVHNKDKLPFTLSNGKGFDVLVNRVRQVVKVENFDVAESFKKHNQEFIGLGYFDLIYQNPEHEVITEPTLEKNTETQYNKRNKRK